MINSDTDKMNSTLSSSFFMGNIEYFTIFILLLNFLGSVGIYLAKI